jgi:hypothetical protein
MPILRRRNGWDEVFCRYTLISYAIMDEKEWMGCGFVSKEIFCKSLYRRK